MGIDLRPTLHEADTVAPAAFLPPTLYSEFEVGDTS